MAPPQTVSGLTVPDGQLGEWLRVNAFGLIVLAFHLGVAWREFLEHRRRLVALERKYDETIPATYVRADVLAPVLHELSTRLDALSKSKGRD